MRFSDVFTAKSIAFRLTSDPSNQAQYIGEAFFPVKKKMGIDLKWIKAHKGVGVVLAPSAYDALATIRPREGFTIMAEEMPLFRESMKVSEQDEAELMRIQESADPYVQNVIDHVYDDINNLYTGAKIATEKMRMGLLAPANGEMKLTIGTKDNTVYGYDYDANDVWKGTNFLELQGTMKWDAPSTCKPLNDIQTAIDTLAGKGYNAQYALMNTTTLNLLVRAAQIANGLITVTGRNVDYKQIDINNVLALPRLLQEQEQENRKKAKA